MSDAQSLYSILKQQEQDKSSSETGLCLEKWRELGKNGVSIPMRIPLHGFSMTPLIRPEKDMVTIVPLTREPMVGDIVLFKRSDGKTITHRVYKVFPNRIQTCGDSCLNADASINRTDIYGLVVSVERNGKIYQLDTDKQRTYGIRWLKYGRPMWVKLKRIKTIGGKVMRHISILFKRC